MERQVRKVKRGGKKSKSLAAKVKAIKPDVDNTELVQGYVGALQLLTLDFIDRYQGEHPIIEEIRAKIRRDPNWLPDTYSISRIFAAAQLYAALTTDESETFPDITKGRRQAMIDRLLANELPDSLADPDFD